MRRRAGETCAAARRESAGMGADGELVGVRP